jgi:galactonate dehydratase
MQLSRRHFFAGALLPALTQASQADRSNDRIAKLEIFRVRVNRRGGWLLARITTDRGVSGLGDASHGGRDQVVRGLMMKYFETLRGGSPWQVESYKQKLLPDVLRSGRTAAVASSALEQCLWDICGKVAGQPVHRLLGGALHDRIRCYANINRSTFNREPEGFAETAKAAAAAGFGMIKMASFDGMPRTGTAEAIAAHTDRGVRAIEAVRRVVGPMAEILVDGHSNFNLDRGKEVMRRLEPVKLSWLEELVPGAAALAEINRDAPMPTAGGESLFGVLQFYRYLTAGAVDIAMPDVKYCGGVTELKKIAAIAEGAGLQVSPHGPASPVGHAVGVHLCATIPNLHSLEYSFGETSWREQLVTPPEKLENGYTRVPDRPGWGLELNMETVREQAASE